jgi:hypothetical protein
MTQALCVIIGSLTGLLVYAMMGGHLLWTAALVSFLVSLVTLMILRRISS